VSSTINKDKKEEMVGQKNNIYLTEAQKKYLKDHQESIEKKKFDAKKKELKRHLKEL